MRTDVILYFISSLLTCWAWQCSL